MATIPLERLSAKQGPAFIDRVHAMRQKRVEMERKQEEHRLKWEEAERRKEEYLRSREERLRWDAAAEAKKEQRAAQLRAEAIAQEEERKLELARAKKTQIQCVIGFAIALGLVTLIAVV